VRVLNINSNEDYLPSSEDLKTIINSNEDYLPSSEDLKTIILALSYNPIFNNKLHHHQKRVDFI